MRKGERQEKGKDRDKQETGVEMTAECKEKRISTVWIKRKGNQRNRERRRNYEAKRNKREDKRVTKGMRGRTEKRHRDENEARKERRGKPEDVIKQRGTRRGKR